jgi:hypothetical protein
MSLANKHVSPDRIEFSGHLSLSEIEELACNADLRVLQCSSPVDPATWDLINSELLTRRPEIQLRVFGFYSSVCDLSFVTQLTNVRHFSADCLLEARGVENVAALENLESLSIGIFNLTNFAFLNEVPKGIRQLSLEATRSKKPRLDHLARFHSLRKLYLEGQQNGIEVLSGLTTLEDLTLRSITTQGLEYIAGLDRLTSLDIKLGVIKNLSAIEGKKSIKYLELWQIQGLRNISVISTLLGLQYLYLQALRNVIEFPDVSQLASLRRIHLENMKALIDVSALSQSTSLRELVHISAQNLAPTQYASLLKIPTLKQAVVGFGNKRKNQVFERMMRESGIEKFKGEQFVFE